MILSQTVDVPHLHIGFLGLILSELDALSLVGFLRRSAMWNQHIVRPLAVILFCLFVWLIVWLLTNRYRSVGSAICCRYCRWWSAYCYRLMVERLWFCVVCYVISLKFGARIRIVDCATVCLLGRFVHLLDALAKLQNLWHLVYRKWLQNYIFFKRLGKSFFWQKKAGESILRTIIVQ